MRDTGVGTGHGLGTMSMRLIPLLALTALLSGCLSFGTGVDVRLHDNLPRIADDQEIEMWVGETEREKIEIAIVSSSRSADLDRATREAQLQEVRDIARRIGASGLENLRVETAEVEGFVSDPQVPFTAWKQGEFELYYLRGTAVRLLDTAPLD